MNAFTQQRQRRITTTAIAAAVVASFSAAPASADDALADLVERVSPSVVTVLASQAVDGESASPARKMPGGRALEEFFRGFGGPGRNPEEFERKGPRRGLGSGFILDEDGWIVTNHHVVDGADEIMVRLEDRRSFQAEIVGVDEETDLALLRIDADEDLPAVALGDSDAIRVGEDVAAVGNPFGLGGTVTEGIVSAKGRNITSGPYAEFIQTDAAINRGNSGGPLFNMDGEVVGVNSAIFSPTGGSVGIGFAVSSNIVAKVMADLREDGEVSRGWLGVSIQDVTPVIADALDLDAPRGALVASVLEGGPSEGGLEAGDVVLAFDGKEVESSRDLPKLVAAVRAGTSASIDILRDGEMREATVEIGELPEARQANADGADLADRTASEVLGATLEKLTPEARAALGLDEDADGAVVTSLDAGGQAVKAGLRVGDVILRIDDEDVRSPEALDRALAAREGSAALIRVLRDGSPIFVAVKIA